MKKIDMRFDAHVFQKCVGKIFEKYRCDEFKYTNSVTQIVGIYIDGHIYKMANVQEKVDYFGNEEDMAVCKFTECEDKDIKSAFVEGRMMDTPIEGSITRIRLINENQKIFKDGVQTYDVWLTRGIVFDVNEREISFEKENVPFSEEIIIRRGYDLIKRMGNVKDFSEDWDNDIYAVATRDVQTIE